MPMGQNVDGRSYLTVLLESSILSTIKEDDEPPPRVFLAGRLVKIPTLVFPTNFPADASRNISDASRLPA
jgi:hypothetical protein